MNEFTTIFVNLVEELNYTNKIIYFESDLSRIIESLLKLSHTNHMYNWEHCLKNNLFYIENCDLQYIAKYELRDGIEWLNDYTLYEVRYNSNDELIIIPSERDIISIIENGVNYEICRSDN